MVERECVECGAIIRLPEIPPSLFKKIKCYDCSEKAVKKKRKDIRGINNQPPAH